MITVIIGASIAGGAAAWTAVHEIRRRRAQAHRDRIRAWNIREGG